VPTNMQDMLVQDMLDEAFAAGRAAERKMGELTAAARMRVNQVVATASTIAPTGNGSRKRIGHAAKAAGAPKAPTVARGVKKVAKPRTKGVKDAVINLIASETLAVPDIVSRLGFKEGSVRAVLMDLKKSGRTVQDENKRWAMAPGAHESGNSGTEATA
jgi:hypothetical protein